MKIGRVIHQQSMQLRWHFLACFGLMMALPIEEAILSLKDGDGFYATGVSLGVSIMAAPLLAGLIACANVQADLDERRYIFWRSKPVGVKSFMAIKYLVGLFVAFGIIASPIAFTLISCMLQNEKIEQDFITLIINFQLLSLLAYSLCFFCNVLVRKTARAWLIGMAMTVFLLLVPFILPLNFKDSRDIIFAASIICLSVTLGPSLIAFVASLFAVNRNWHLKTNLKGLLWVGSLLIFMIMMFFSRQVANIKILDIVKIPTTFSGDLVRVGHQILLNETPLISVDNDNVMPKELYISPSLVTVDNGNIILKKLHFSSSEEVRAEARNAIPASMSAEGFKLYRFPGPWPRYMDCRIGSQDISFSLCSYYIQKKYTNKRGKKYTFMQHEKIYLKSFKNVENCRLPISTVDLSEIAQENSNFTIHPTMRMVSNNLMIMVGSDCFQFEVNQQGEMKQISRSPLKRYSREITRRDAVFKIPILKLEKLDIQERLRLTIDYNYRFFIERYNYQSGFWNHSLVQMADDSISFTLVTKSDIARYDVVKWDSEYVYCQYRDSRPFTFSEQMFDKYGHREYFVREDKLYVYNETKLMVFDIGSRHIRKLGHFERRSRNCSLYDVVVLDSGNILITTGESRLIDDKRGRAWNNYLYLLKNPE